jgi:hypothetical protein
VTFLEVTFAEEIGAWAALKCLMCLEKSDK